VRRTAYALVLSAIALTGSAALADPCDPSPACYELTPCPPDLYDLNHACYYTWGISRPWGDMDVAVSACLTFKSIRNWTTEPNVLYVHLLDDAPLGVRSYRDNQGGGDNFARQGVLLVQYNNLPATPQTLTYVFTPDQVAALNACAADGRFALAFDPDCHFYNCGVELEVCTAPVPEPSALAIASLGGVFMVGRRRRFRLK